MSAEGFGRQQFESRYRLILEARAAFADGKNVSAHLRATEDVAGNDAATIEIAYDLQAGSYTKRALDHLDQLWEYGRDLAHVLKSLIRPDDVILDAGTGECTALVAALNALPPFRKTLAFDLSWSRLAEGRRFARRFLAEERSRPELFVADMQHLPLRDHSVDLVLTVHALEPNGGNELSLLNSLMSVTRRHLVLFEPSYERASPAAQARMRHHGYVRGLEAAIKAAGGILDDVIELPRPVNELNPTHAFIVRTQTARQARRLDKHEVWQCPITKRPLTAVPDGLWCPDAGLLYPAILSIPVLTRQHAILASGYEAELGADR